MRSKECSIVWLRGFHAMVFTVWVILSGCSGPQSGAGTDTSTQSTSPTDTSTSGIDSSSSVPSSTGASASDPSTLTPSDSSSGSLPGQIEQAGASQGSPPVAALPAPAESKSQIESIIKRFGLRSVTGSNATPQVLSKLEDAYSRFPTGSFRNLDLVFEPATADTPSTGAGVWNPLKSDGQPAMTQEECVAATGGRITYTGNIDQDMWDLIHEGVHHLTLCADRDFGRSLIEKLGYKGSDSAANSATDRFITQENFDASGVTDSSYPTAYSRMLATEHIAELVTLWLGRGLTSSPMDTVNANFQMPSASEEVLKAKLGPRPVSS